MSVLNKSEGGKTVSVSAKEFRDDSFAFNSTDVLFRQDADDLVLLFGDGAKVVIKNYFQIFGNKLPDLALLDGLKHLGPEDFNSDWDRPHDDPDNAPARHDDENADAENPPLTEGSPSDQQEGTDKSAEESSGSQSAASDRPSEPDAHADSPAREKATPSNAHSSGAHNSSGAVQDGGFTQ